MVFELFFTVPYFRRVLITALLVGLVAATIGVFLVLRNLALLGDGLGHVTFGGVAIGLVFGILPLFAGLIFAILAALAIHYLQSREIVSGDTAIGIFFTGALALGLVMLSFGQGITSTVEGYLFGNILLVTTGDLWFVLIIAVVLLVSIILFYQEFFAMTFDEEGALVQGLPTRALSVFFTILTACAIVVISQIVGVLMISALLITPAATAMQYAKGFRQAIFISMGLATASIIIGLFFSSELGLGTGATIAVVSTIFFFVGTGLSRLFR